MTPGWYRSWPAAPPPGRARVEDHLDRLTITDYDLWTAAEGMPDDEPGWCLLEWDVALDSDERARFAEVAMEAPDRVLVAPYLIFPVGSDQGVCVHKVALDRTRMAHRTPAAAGRAEVDSFGFGCIYFPAALVARFGARRRLADNVFSTWHIEQGLTARCDWSFHPQHLHGD